MPDKSLSLRRQVLALSHESQVLGLKSSVLDFITAVMTQRISMQM